MDLKAASVAIDEQLRTTLGEHLDGTLVTRWLTIIEVIDHEGDRALAQLAPDDIAAWDRVGMYRWALQAELDDVPENRDEE